MTINTTNRLNRRGSRQRQGGWNLIELLVVISIISILLAILINAAAEGKGPLEQTKVTMKAAMGLATEYEVRTTQYIDHAGGTGADSIGRFCYQLWSIADLRTGLYALGKDAVPQAGTTAPVAIMDGWGRPMRYCRGGDSMPTETGMVKYRAPYLASAGPDGNWGTVNPTTNVPDAAAADNVYSFNLE